MIPRLYGTMRVAGTVVWSTDLIEEETVEGGGKGAQATQGYKYSVSLAVSLSSRPIKSVGRIWADGKLIRGVDGDFKVRTGFRLLDGSEDQAIDPLIASIETIAKTPAYRGQALAIFEGLELAEFGNRIPLMTFEVAADDAAVASSEIVRDIADLTESGPVDGLFMGYAAHGGSKRDAIAGIVELTGTEILDDGTRLHWVAEGASTQVDDDQLGCAADGSVRHKLEHVRSLDSSRRSIALSFYDPDRDYQAGEVRVAAGVGGERDERTELPAAMTAATAKSLAERIMACRQQDESRLTVRLPPQFVGVLPGQALNIAGVGTWQVHRLTIEEMAVVAELSQPAGPVRPTSADGGRATREPDRAIGRTEMMMFELPQPGGTDGPVIALSNDGLWKTVPVEVSINGVASGGVSVARKARMGRATTTLPDGSPALVDRINSVAVAMVDPEQRLFNADDEAIAAGANMALLGSEIIQFCEAHDFGDGNWRLGGLVRGRWGTEWAMAGHTAGERFCMLNSAVQSLGQSGMQPGSIIRATAHGVADASPLPQCEVEYGAEHRKPPSPAALSVTSDGTHLSVQWTARTWEAFGWSNTVDPPALPVRITIESGGGAISIDASNSPATVPLTTVPGSGARSINVYAAAVSGSQISSAATATITI